MERGEGARRASRSRRCSTRWTRCSSEQAKKIAIPRRFEATIKEIWSLQPRFEQRSGQRPFRLLEHPRFRAGWDFLELRCKSGELEGELAGLADWWDRFANAGADEREAMLKPDEGPKQAPRARAAAGASAAPTAMAAPPDAPADARRSEPHDARLRRPRQQPRPSAPAARARGARDRAAAAARASSPSRRTTRARRSAATTPQPDYVNAVVARAHGARAPRALLAALHAIERRQHRRRDAERGATRRARSTSICCCSAAAASALPG